MIDLGIAHFTCDCGAMICPPTTISTKGNTYHKEIINFPTSPDKIPDDALMSEDTFNEIQNGDHDDVSDLAKFKGMSYKDIITTRRAEYKNWRDAEVISLTAKADDMESSFQANANSVTRTDTDDNITIVAERYEAIIEGDITAGRAICPVCDKELCSWRH